MDTLRYQRERLESEIIDAKASIQMIRESEFPDLSAVQQLMESIARHKQLIGMIDHHLLEHQQSIQESQ